MPRKIRQLKADLRRMGAWLVGEVGDHEKWKHPLVADVYVELSGKDGADARPYQEQRLRELERRVAEEKRKQQP